MAKLKKGLVHIYTGEGKGKTTAALGLALRAAGGGLKVCFFQFYKGGKFPCKEADAVKKLGGNFKFKRFEITHPLFKKVNPAKVKPQVKKAINEVCGLILSGRFDLVILDEILIGVPQGFVDEKIILNIIKEKPRTVELVLTGRGATEKLIDSADYVTYMKDIKHPFTKGMAARKGIEF